MGMGGSVCVTRLPDENAHSDLGAGGNGRHAARAGSALRFRGSSPRNRQRPGGFALLDTIHDRAGGAGRRGRCGARGFAWRRDDEWPRSGVEHQASGRRLVGRAARNLCKAAKRAPCQPRATSPFSRSNTTSCNPRNFRRSGGSSPGRFHRGGGGISRGNPSRESSVPRSFVRESRFRRR